MRVSVRLSVCHAFSQQPPVTLSWCQILADFRRASGDQQANSVGRVQHERLHLGL